MRATLHVVGLGLLLLAVLLTACGKDEPPQDEATEDVDDDAPITDVIEDGPPPMPPLAELTFEQRLIALATEPVPWVDLGELAVSLYDARLSFHRIEGGPVFDLGTADALKYTQGRWRAPWLDATLITEEQALADDLPMLSNRRIVWNEGAGASLRFPLPEDLGQEEPWVLLVKMRPKSLLPRMEVRLNEHGQIGIVDLTPNWSVVQLEINPKKLNFGGENTLGFVFANSYFQDQHRVAARFDWVRLVPKSQVPDWIDKNPVPDLGVEDARILTTSRRAIGIPAPMRLDTYQVIPAHGRLRMFIGPAPLTQTGTRLKVSIRSDDMPEPETIFDTVVQPGSPWMPREVDLTQWADKAVRISFDVETGAQGSTGQEPAIFVGEPAIIVLRPDRTRLAKLTEEERPNRIIMIGIDALRADRIAPEGTLTHPATPILSKLANDGVRLEAVAAGAGSVTPTASILTGTYPDTHGVFDTLTHIRESQVTIGDVFDEAGWETGLLSTDPFVKLKLGYAQGFDRYRNLVEEDGPARTDRLIEAARRVVKKASKRSRILYLQIGGLRLPHRPGDEAKAQFFSGSYSGPITIDTMMNPAALPPKLGEADIRYVNALYDAELWEIDLLIGQLLQSLQEVGGLEKTLIVVFGVHGEPLGEDSMLGYNNRLSHAELRVPVIFYYPSRFKAGTRPAETIQLLDIYPTILSTAGLDRPEGVQGKSIRRILEGEHDNSSSAVFMARAETHRGVVMGNYHYLLRSGDNDVLYDVSFGGKEATVDHSQELPIARRAGRDALGIHLGYVESWGPMGKATEPRKGFAPFAIERGW